MFKNANLLFWVCKVLSSEAVEKRESAFSRSRVCYILVVFKVNKWYLPVV